MRITKEVYEQLLACSKVPPERGGILGASNGKIINHFMLDSSSIDDCGGVYSPNTNFLNQIIEDWAKSGIEFRGIFHTHAPQWSVLSKNDRVYIIDILNAMPSYITQLYFPLVFPGRNIRGYNAKRKNNAIDIIDDDIEIIKSKEITKNEQNK